MRRATAMLVVSVLSMRQWRADMESVTCWASDSRAMGVDFEK